MEQPNIEDKNLTLYEKETVIKFIQTKIKKHSNFEDILSEIPHLTIKTGKDTVDKSLKGFYYERLWDLCIKFGVTNLTLPSVTPNSKSYLQTSHIINANTNDNTSVHFEENCWAGDKLNASRTGYLRQKVRSGKSGGYSDITFINKPHGGDKEEVFFISVKYFEHEQDISKYDIGKLCTLIREHEKENRAVKIYIFVNNKKNAIEKFKKQNASSNILIKYINPNGEYEHIYDSQDLHDAYYKLRRLLEQYNYFEKNSDIDDFQQTYLEQLKKQFIPRFHQSLFIRKIRDLVKSKNKNILVGAIPRSGKSYIMAGTIIDCIEQQKDKSKKLTFLMMTPAPNETFPEYEGMFKQYSDFDRLGVKPIYMDTSDLESVVDADKHCVIVISKQRLGWSSSKLEKLANNEVVSDAEKEEDEEVAPLDKEEDELARIRKRVSELFGGRINIDYMFLDEAHFGMSTKKAQDIVAVLDDEAKNTTKIYVTATYNKPLETYGIDAECKLTWDINDIEIMKNISKTNILNNDIATRFGKVVYEDALDFLGDKTGESLVPKLQKEYSMYPKPYLITSLWDKDFLQFEKARIGETDFGWDMGKLFATDGTNFKNKEQMTEMMRYYFGQPNKRENYNVQAFYRSRGILPRIQKICTNKCRTLQTLHKTTQLWFLPLKGAAGDTIDKRVIALINLFKHTNEFKHILKTYHFYIAVDVKKKENHENFTYMKDPHKIKGEIEALEDQIKRGEFKGENKPDNLIILAGQRLQLGISLRNVDIVTLWNSTMSDDALFQMLFRSMTEVDVPPCVENEYCNEKKFGFMVDMNPQRAIMNVSLFNTNMAKPKDTKTGKIQEYTQIFDLINIDEDVFQDKYDGDEKQKDEFVRELFKKLYSAWDVSSDGIRKTVSKFALDQGILESIKDEIRGIQMHSDKKNAKEIQKPSEDEQVSPGRKQEPKNAEKKGKQNKPPTEINLQQIAVEIISELVTLLNIFTLYLDDGSKCILTGSSELDEVRIVGEIGKLKQTVFADAKRKDIFLKILNGRLNGNPEIPYPVTIIDKVLESVSNTTNVMLLDKMAIDQKTHYYTINDPRKLLEFINRELKPKEKEKKENGEVFTPVKIVEEMFNKFPQEVWSNPNYKWLDPAVGIGNFPIIIYLKLMEGLKLHFPIEETRRTHILENMLYMVEISEKSIFILNKIFCGDKYKLNIHKGSFLSGEYNPPFKFDVIVGNPPYNPPKTKTGSSGNNIWTQFVIKSFYSLSEKGYLCFIHPPGWKKPTDEVFDPIKLDILKGEYYNYDKKTGKQTLKQIRQGQVWKLLKEHGAFYFIYTNDQKNKKIEDYIPYFPAVDYYVYQKNGDKSVCDTKNVFLGEVIESRSVRLNYELNYLPNLITIQTQNILHKIISKPGEKPNFVRYRNAKGFSINPSNGQYKYIYTYNKKHEPKYQYSDNIGDDNINLDKVIMNFDGGIDCYTVDFIKKEKKIGSYEMTMYSKVETESEGKHIELFFNSKIVKFIFLITQYASGKMTKNEVAIANSITIPPEYVTNYYKFFEIEQYKNYIEHALRNYITHPENEHSQESIHSVVSARTPERGTSIGVRGLSREDLSSKDNMENPYISTLVPRAGIAQSPEKLPLSESKLSPKSPTKQPSLSPPSSESKKRSSKISIPSAMSKSKRKTKKTSQNPQSTIAPAIDSKIQPGKIFNPVTKRLVKDTKANRKKIGFPGGAPKNKTRKTLKKKNT
jgi:hypothetical protein